MTAHHPPELEAVELDGAWYVRTKPEIGKPEIVADLSMARYGKEWARLIVSAISAMHQIAEQDPIEMALDATWAKRIAIAAAEGRAEPESQ